MRRDWRWACWLAAIAASFAYLEHAAYVRRTHPTLSRTLARWLGICPRTRWGRFGPLAFAAGWAILTVHVARVKETHK